MMCFFLLLFLLGSFGTDPKPAVLLLLATDAGARCFQIQPTRPLLVFTNSNTLLNWARRGNPRM